MITVIEAVDDHIIHMSNSKNGQLLVHSALIAEDCHPVPGDRKDMFEREGDTILFKNLQGDTVLVETGHGLQPREVMRYHIDG